MTKRNDKAEEHRRQLRADALRLKGLARTTSPAEFIEHFFAILDRELARQETANRFESSTKLIGTTRVEVRGR